MILDNELYFGNGWAPTATGDNISTNVTDTGPLSGTPTANAFRDLGMGEPLWFEALVTTAVTSAGAATVDFRFRTGSVADLTSSSPVDLVSSGAIAKATLIAGYLALRVRLPSATYKRYIGANANIGTAALTAGAFNVRIVKDIQSNTKYAGGFSIDV